MSDAERGQSMEDILASIKRIITDDVAAARPIAVADGDDEDVLELGGAAPIPPAPPVAEPLVSAGAREASARALASLATLRVNAQAPDDTLDGLVRAMLRPMLKDWLDANLPELVERIVAREVARLVGR